LVQSNQDTEERIVGVLHDIVEDCAPKDYTWDREDFSHFQKLSKEQQPEKNTWEHLIAEGLKERLFDALQSVSKTPAEEAEYKSLLDDKKLDHYLEFIQRAKTNSIGRNVKEADIKDNLDISRISVITANDDWRLKRYKVALELLTL